MELGKQGKMSFIPRPATDRKQPVSVTGICGGVLGDAEGDMVLPQGTEVAILGQTSGSDRGN